MTAPVLVIGYGNPSRGDDAVGPEFVRRLELRCANLIARGIVEVLTDFQLQVELTLDLQGREQVYFVDASAEANAPGYAVRAVVPAADRAAATHALSPAALLSTFEAVMREPAPETFVIAIRGERFELGDPIGAEAEAHLAAALDDVVGRLEARHAA